MPNRENATPSPHQRALPLSTSAIASTAFRAVDSYGPRISRATPNQVGETRQRFLDYARHAFDASMVTVGEAVEEALIHPDCDFLDPTDTRPLEPSKAAEIAAEIDNSYTGPLPERLSPADSALGRRALLYAAIEGSPLVRREALDVLLYAPNVIF